MRNALLALVLATCIASVRPGAQSTPTLTLLDRYAKGDFTKVVAELAEVDNFKDLLKDLDRDAGKWISAGGPADVDRRELAAATFALEAARADEWEEWKWIQKQSDGPLSVLYWKPPPLLIEWGCELLRREELPRPIERIWQLAAMAVAQRGEDTQFLIGFSKVDGPEPLPTPRPADARPPVQGPPGIPLVMTQRPGRNPLDEMVNGQKEIGHLNHVVERFPKEKRFMLGEAIARDRAFAPDGVKVYSSLVNDPDVGGEATLRLGALHLRQNRIPDAMDAFARVERLTRDPDLIYLARFFRGQALLRSKRESDAISAFRGALAARPATQSASVVLASLLIRAGKRTEAQDLVKAVLDAGSGYGDPNIEYVHGDDRFWPALIGRLRREIKQ